jgi:type I site-specific restriction-modification system R (restriction) subunit
VIDGKSKKRPDVVLFVNGLPLAVLELKNPVAENADAHDAFVQLGNYKDAIKSLMNYNEALVVSDGNRAIQTVEVIEELLAIARALQEARAQGKQLNLSEEEEAFFDALATNKSAVEVMGNHDLAFLAQEIAEVIRKNVSIDWTMKEQVRAKLRTLVKRKLRQHGYPPDMQERAVEKVLQQAEAFASEWVG